MLDERIELTRRSINDFLDEPSKINDLEVEDKLDILASFQFYFELVQAQTRAAHSEHSWQFMAAHADTNFWKNKLMNAKAELRLMIANKERGL